MSGPPTHPGLAPCTPKLLLPPESSGLGWGTEGFGVPGESKFPQEPFPCRCCASHHPFPVPSPLVHLLCSRADAEPHYPVPPVIPTLPGPGHAHPPCPDTHSLPTPEERPPASPFSSESTGGPPHSLPSQNTRGSPPFSLRDHSRIPPILPSQNTGGSPHSFFKEHGRSSPFSPHRTQWGPSILSPQRTQRSPPFSPQRS